MLIKTTDIKPEPPSPPSTSSGGDALNGRTEPVSLIQENADTSVFIAEIDKSLTKAIGQLQNGKTTHFYSWGNFNLVRLIMYILKQTGPAHAFMTSYSFSQKSIEQLKNRMDKKELLSFRVIIDNRVKSMSPLPFQMLKSCFDYRCTSIHAKIALIWNEKWHIRGHAGTNIQCAPEQITTEKANFPAERVIFKEYESGHMLYLGKTGKLFSDDLRSFILSCSK